uniref:Uncharacterized protein n=1 Tax=Rhodococcus sp. NS1 TaxID=402236 RepID=A0A097SQI5_9NOCA|nr:hypothetical protein LRS1606.357 [Rhodococcus sp. NS1]
MSSDVLVDEGLRQTSSSGNLESFFNCPLSNLLGARRIRIRWPSRSGSPLASSDTGRMLDVVVDLLPEVASVLLVQVDGVLHSIDSETDGFPAIFQRSSIDVVESLNDCSTRHRLISSSNASDRTLSSLLSPKANQLRNQHHRHDQVYSEIVARLRRSGAQNSSPTSNREVCNPLPVEARRPNAASDEPVHIPFMRPSHAPSDRYSTVVRTTIEQTRDHTKQR